MKFTTVTKVLEKHTDELRYLNHVFALQFLAYARDDWYTVASLWDGQLWSDEETLLSIVWAY